MRGTQCIMRARAAALLSALLLHVSSATLPRSYWERRRVAAVESIWGHGATLPTRSVPDAVLRTNVSGMSAVVWSLGKPSRAAPALNSTVYHVRKGGAASRPKRTGYAEQLTLCPEQMKRMLSQGADPNATDQFGYTALMWASSQGHYERSKLLIGGKADVNMQRDGGSTALMRAAPARMTQARSFAIGSSATPRPHMP